jgi:hypothetical protein
LQQINSFEFDILQANLRYILLLLKAEQSLVKFKGIYLLQSLMGKIPVTTLSVHDLDDPEFCPHSNKRNKLGQRLVNNSTILSIHILPYVFSPSFISFCQKTKSRNTDVILAYVEFLQPFVWEVSLKNPEASRENNEKQIQMLMQRLLSMLDHPLMFLKIKYDKHA